MGANPTRASSPRPRWFRNCTQMEDTDKDFGLNRTKPCGARKSHPCLHCSKLLLTEQILCNTIVSKVRGSSTVVVRRLAKAKVASSTLVSRSRPIRNHRLRGDFLSALVPRLPRRAPTGAARKMSVTPSSPAPDRYEIIAFAVIFCR